MMGYETIDVEQTNGLMVVWLNRPQKKNSFNLLMIRELTHVLKSIMDHPEVSTVVLRGRDNQFCSGADLNWMRESGQQNRQENIRDSEEIVNLLESLDSYPIPLIGIAEGAVFGGAIGLLANCDWVFSEKTTRFCFSEIKLGLAAATILPYVVKRMNRVRALQLMLTGVIFTAEEARLTGLVDEIYDRERLEIRLSDVISQLKDHPVNALKQIKRLARESRYSSPEEMKWDTIETLSDLKESDEAQSRLSSFMERNSR